MSSSAFALSAKSRKVLRHSSSGGVFYLLASYFLNDLNGAVYGVTIEGSNVFHVRITDFRNIKKLLKSKYVKSDLKNTFSECKADLTNGKHVLYVGLPCQIHSLHTYLSMNSVNTEKLLLVDLICHGAPNKKTFDDYLNNNFKDETVLDVDFRFKKPFWEGYYIRVKTDKQTYLKPKFCDEYMSDFLNGYNLDEPCYKCPFKKDNRKSAITIGDFWGVKELYPKFYNNRGTSLLIIHDVEKCEFILDYLKKRTQTHQVSLDDALKFNKSYSEVTEKPKHKPIVKNGSKFKLKHFCVCVIRRFLKRK